MSYIGNQPTVGQYRKLDDISGSFNGSLTAFTMQVSSTNVTAGSAFQLLISLGGVIQEPGTDFTVSGSTITFTTAPAASLSFFGIMMGQPLNTATPGDSTVTGAKIVDGTITGGKLAAAFNYDSGLLFLDDTNNRVGVGTASPAVKLHISGAGTQVIRFEETGSSVIGKVFVTTSKAGIATQSNHDLSFEANNDEKARIDTSGRLLVGNQTARANFNNSTDTTRFQVEGTDAGTSSLALICNNGGGVPVASLHLAKSDGTSVGSNGRVGGSWNVGDIRFSGNDGAEFVEAARIEAEIDGTPAANDMPGRLIFSTTASGAAAPTERMRIHESGKITVRTTNITNNAELTLSAILNSGDPTLNCTVGLTAGNVDTVIFRDNSGHNCGAINVNAGTNTTSYGTSSDYRLKENVVPLIGAIERLNQLQVKRFNFISEPETVLDGFLAHEAQEVVPECATHSKDAVEVWKEGDELPDGVSVGDKKLDEDGNTIPVYQNIDQSKLVPLLTAALQEAIAKIETLEARLTALEGGTP